jgi:DEAD/DEAH box helicase domain-containing protein
LGIDVGSLDAAIINTFPGTIASFRQQAGRAGRTRQTSLATLVAGEDALDQYFMTHPGELFARPPEAAVINPDNPMVVEAHTAAAAYELPLSIDDREFLGTEMEEAANRLVQRGDLRVRDERLYWVRRHRPGRDLSIRSSGGPIYTVVDLDGGEPLGEVEEQRAFRDAHPGAIYLHHGDTYLVESLDFAEHVISVRNADVGYYTQPKEEKVLEILEVESRDRVGLLDHYLGRVRVETHVIGFRRRQIRTGESLGLEYLDLPPSVFETQAIWFTVHEGLFERAEISSADVPGTLHAAEHAGIAMLPLFAICDRWDIGGLSTPIDPQTGKPTIYIYEGYPGGAGISPIAFAAGTDHLRATLEAVRSCPCDSGCPSCVQSPKCGNFNEPLSKGGAVRFLQAAL